MGSTFTTMPGIFDQTSILGTKRKMPVYLQFVPGIVVKGSPGEDNLNHQSSLKKINSIIAMPHETNKGIKRPGEAGEEFRYYPLLRGIQESPTPGDPVLLCTMADENYYLGPLNTNGSPTFNEDRFKDDKIKSSFNNIVNSEGSLKSPLFSSERLFARLQKLLNSKLDHPSGQFISDTIPGDLMLEGRHGNSIRIGSRHVNPYIIISNGRASDNPVETSLDGTVVGIFNHGSIRDHFNNDPLDINTNENYKFKLADDEISKVYKSISKTFQKPLGHGGNSELNSNVSLDLTDTIYNYSSNQFFLSSDRITFNARKESVFLAAREHIHIGCGSSMTFSTSRNILTEAQESVVTNTKGNFEVNADTVYIDGRKKIVLGNPLADPPDSIEHAVLGESLVTQLSNILWLMKEMCYVTSNAIENSGLSGGSLSTMKEVIESIDNTFGMVPNPIPMVGEYPQGMASLILSNRVKLKR